MGAEVSTLDEVEFEDRKYELDDKTWKFSQAFSDTGLHSAFTIKDNSTATKSLFKNAIKNLKTLKHPGLLKFNSFSHDTIITERVVPLSYILNKLDPYEITSGLVDIINVLNFLHKANLSHNNISHATIFSDEYGHWKLGGLELLCPFDKLDDSYLELCKNVHNEAYICKKGIEKDHTGDVFSFLVLCIRFIDLLKNFDASFLRSFNMQIEKQMLNCQLPNTPDEIITFLNEPIFQNDYIKIVSFLRNITLKTNEEKKIFFTNLPLKLYYNLPEKLVAARLTRLILSRFVLIDDNVTSVFIPHFLTPSYILPRLEKVDPTSQFPIITKKLYKKFVIPELLKIFYVRNLEIRITLLKYFEDYYSLFDTADLQEIILPEILVGLKDENDALVSLTLIALSLITQVLGSKSVVGGQRLKMFVSAIPKFNVPFRLEELSKRKPSEAGLELKSIEDVLVNCRNEDKKQVKVKTLADLAKESNILKMKKENLLKSESSQNKIISQINGEINSSNNYNHFDDKEYAGMDIEDSNALEVSDNGIEISNINSSHVINSNNDQVNVKDLKIYKTKEMLLKTNNSSTSNSFKIKKIKPPCETSSQKKDSIDEELGSEFQIKVKVKPSAEEKSHKERLLEEMFAEMEPKIRNKESTSKTLSKTMFDMIDSQLEVETKSGWNDESWENVE